MFGLAACRRANRQLGNAEITRQSLAFISLGRRSKTSASVILANALAATATRFAIFDFPLAAHTRAAMSDSEGRERGTLANIFRRRATRPPAGEERDSNVGCKGHQGSEHIAEKQPLASPSIRNRTTTATRLPAGILLYLVVTGLVAAATIGVFFAIGFPMLVQPVEETIAGSGANDRSPELDPLPPGGLPRPDSDLSPALAMDNVVPGSAIEAVQLRAAAPPQVDVAHSENPITQADLVVAQWGFGYSLETARRQALQGNWVRGRPLYLAMTLNGTQAAVDHMRIGPLPAIEVRWARENDSAPVRVVKLTIGGPGVANALEQQVRGRGFFEWQTSARRNALDTGAWTISLTFPNGQPLLCGQEARPCRFTIYVS